MEIVYKVLSPAVGSVVHYGLVHVEEALEMCGAVLVLRAAWLVMAPDGFLVVTVGPALSTPTTAPEQALTPAD